MTRRSRWVRRPRVRSRCREGAQLLEPSADGGGRCGVNGSPTPRLSPRSLKVAGVASAQGNGPGLFDGRGTVKKSVNYVLLN